MKSVVRPCITRLQFAQDLLFGVGVDTGQRVVQDQDAGVADDGASDGRSLLLASGERDPALAHHGRQAGGKFFKFAPDVGRLSGLQHLFIAGQGSAKGDVSANGLAE